MTFRFHPARVLLIAGAVFGLSSAEPALAQSANVKITGLTDLAFGSLTDTVGDSKLTENICAFSSSATKGYRVTASGSGSANAFTIASTGSTLAYEVEWNSTSGQSTGTNLTTNVPLTGLISTATQQQCNNGPATTASLIVLFRGTSVAAAAGGSYTGTLTLVLGVE